MTPPLEPPSASDGYERIAERFDAERGPKPWEWPFFETLAQQLGRNARVLDCGCGSGHLGLARLIEAGHEIIGLDGSAAMLALFRRRYPSVPTIHGDMRRFEPDEPQEAIIAWDSLFHLSQHDQAAMIPRLGQWLAPGGRLLFTSGPADGHVTGSMFGVPFSYSSFDEAGYRDLLTKAGFVEIHSTFDEPQAPIHKVWTARKDL